jgi:hexosaminidase
VEIDDEPLFRHRGLNLDVARQWYPKADILRTIDALAWNKMNRLHLHVTDSQSWPLEIPALPELSQKGCYADGLTYSPDDLQDILTWGRERGVEVIVEIDMPGHTTVIAEAYPELIAGRNMQPDWSVYAAQPPSGSLKLRNEGVKAFLATLFADLLPRLRGHTQYFHTGGDEVNRQVYLLDEGIRSNDTTVLKPALQDFFSHVHGELGKHGVTPFVWEEMLLEWNLDLPKDTIVQTWMSEQSTKRVIEKGYRAIAGSYQYWYLDCGSGQWLDFLPKSFENYYPFDDYCAPKKSWRLSKLPPHHTP